MTVSVRALVDSSRSLVKGRFSQPTKLMLFALFASETILVDAFKAPDQMLLRYVAFGDYGSNLTLQRLVAGGLKPGIDFGYHYGLLAVLAGRLWFAITGQTIAAYMAAMLLCGVAIALGNCESLR
jgi:hypothetical protein